MGSRRRSTTSGELRRGYRRPLHRDRALWVAVGLSAVLVVIEFALSSPDTVLGWLAFVLIGVALAALVISLVGIFVGVLRGFADGWRSNRSRAGRSPSPSPSPSPTASEATGTSEGSRPDPMPEEPGSGEAPTLPRPAVPDSIKNLAAAAQARKPTGQDVDRTARALGRAAGAARRAYRKDD